MSAKIVLLNPPYERIAKGYEFLRHITNRSPSLGLLHLAAMVREHGFSPEIIESDIAGLDEEAVVTRIVASAPKYLGITLFTVGVWSAASIARAVKKRLPKITIIVGGPHISSMGAGTIERFGEFEIAVDGEAEWILVKLLQALEAGQPPETVEGLILRQEQEIVSTPRAAELKSLDPLPLPAWDLLSNFPLAFQPAIFDFPGGKVATIAASRGCPFHCRFCDTSTFGARLRAYSPGRVVEIMGHLKERWGIGHIMFVDDLFLASRIRVMEFCDRLEEAALKMTWSCTARVDTVKPDVLQRMRAVGCWEISFGLETGSDDLLKQMDKAACVKSSEQAIQWASQAGIRTKGLFMLGYPGETEDSIELTRKFVRKIPMDMMNLSKFTPYPGSPIYRDLYGTNIRADHWEKMNGMNFVWSPDGFSEEVLDQRYRGLLKSFYSQRRVLANFIKLGAQHPGHLVRLARFGLGVLGSRMRGHKLASAAQAR